jgi:hypothetical protein
MAICPLKRQDSASLAHDMPYLVLVIAADALCVVATPLACRWPGKRPSVGSYVNRGYVRSRVLRECRFVEDVLAVDAIPTSATIPIAGESPAHRAGAENE